MKTHASSTAKNREPQRRRSRSKGRWVVLLTLVVAVGGTSIWLPMAIRDQRRQKAAAEAIEQMGGRVCCKTTWLGRLLRDDSLGRVVNAYYCGRRVTDADLAYLEGLDDLVGLMLEDTSVTDAGLAHLRELHHLRALCLVGDSNLSGNGFVHLQGLSHLFLLYVEDTPITDAGLAQLQGVTQLRLLTLDNTKVTDEGIARLKRTLPHCIIHSDSRVWGLERGWKRRY